MAEYTFVDDPHLLNIRIDVGMTGFGKSSLLEYQLSQICKMNRARPRDRIILVDPAEDDFHFSEFGRKVTTAHEIAALVGAGTHERFHLRLVTTSVEIFDYVCWEAQRQEDVFLVVDEIWNFCPSKGGVRLEPPAFNQLCTQGRHARVRILGTCQRPTQIHNNLLNLAQEVNVFRTEDLDRLRQKLRTKENMERALGLEKFEFFSCRNGEPVLCRVPGTN